MPINPVLRGRIIIAMCGVIIVTITYVYVEMMGWKYILIMKSADPLPASTFIVLLTVAIGLLGGLILKDWKK